MIEGSGKQYAKKSCGLHLSKAELDSLKTDKTLKANFLACSDFKINSISVAVIVNSEVFCFNNSGRPSSSVDDNFHKSLAPAIAVIQEG